MKKFFFVSILNILYAASLLAQGMWQPNLIDEATINDMRSKGFQLDKTTLYNQERPSIKDAIVIFGGGCTGEVIGKDGLLVTNHHCGLGNVQRLSTIQNNYLKNGFWAKSKDEELPCKGLSVTFIVSIEDVSAQIIPLASDLHDEIARTRIVDSISNILIGEAIRGTTYGAYVVPFYNGNQYFLFVTEEFKDIRLVGVPPISIGNYGGDTDNWIWPRHTGDFSLFRIYAKDNNEPAEYSPDNIPYQPKYFLPVSAQGIKEDDFTMVYGFPGRTQQYLSSFAVDLVANVADPIRVQVRTMRLNIWQQFMKKNDTIRLQYQAKYNGVSNAWKKWQGEMKGLQECNVVQLKKDYEQEISKRSTDEFNATQTLKLMNVFYDSLHIYQPILDYTSEALMAPEIFKIAYVLNDILQQASANNFIISAEKKEEWKKNIRGFFKDYNPQADAAVFEALIPLYWENTPASLRIPFIEDAIKKYKNDIHLYALSTYPSSFLNNEKSLITWIENLNRKSKKQLEQDPLYLLAIAVRNYYKLIVNKYQQFNTPLIELNREYMNEQMHLFPEKKFFPDANSTLRIAYGNVKSYNPYDAVTYNWYSTSEGILEKYYTVSADDYVLLPDYEKMLTEKKFGKYGYKDGNLHTCFIASNHTTGGNSGSPVLNARGELVGINFDRVWEGTMSDIYFDPARCRNISLDTRYMLYIIDELGKASYLFNEMTILW